MLEMGDGIVLVCDARLTCQNRHCIKVWYILDSGIIKGKIKYQPLWLDQ